MGIDGNKRLFNLHCNGGVFNLGDRSIELIELLKAGLYDHNMGSHHLNGLKMCSYTR
jgi:hypothetical protein